MTFNISGLGPLPFDPASPAQLPGMDDAGVPFHEMIDDKAAAQDLPRRERGESEDRDGADAERRDAEAGETRESRSERSAERDDAAAERAERREDDDAREQRSADTQAGDDEQASDERAADRADADDNADADNGDDATDADAGDDAGTGEEDAAEASGDDTTQSADAGENDTNSNSTTTDTALPQGNTGAGQVNPEAPQPAAVQTDGDAVVAATDASDEAGASAGTKQAGNEAIVAAEQMAMLSELAVAPASAVPQGDVLPELANLADDGEPGIDLRQALSQLLARNAGNGQGQGQGQGGHAGTGGDRGLATALQNGAAVTANTADAAVPQRAGGEPQFQSILAQSGRAMPPANSAQTTATNLPVTDVGAGTAQAANGAPQGSDPLAAARTNSQAGAPALARPAPLSTNAGIQVAIRLSRAIQDGFNRLSVRLNPPELGRVDIKLDVANDGRAIAMVSADRQETLDLLQRDARGLERALQEAGLRADSGSLSFNLRNQEREGERQTDGNGGTGAGTEDVDADGQALPPIASDRVLDITV